MSRPSTTMTEFLAWRREIDCDELLDVFDLALGFYFGRFPNRPHHHACNFADKARTIASAE